MHSSWNAFWCKMTVLLHILSKPIAKLCPSLYRTDPSFPAWIGCHNIHQQQNLALYSCFRLAQFFYRYGLGLYFNAAVTVTAAEHAGPYSKGCRTQEGWAECCKYCSVPQIPCWAIGMLIHALDSTSLPGNRPTFTTEILQRKPARFQRGLNLEKFASSTAFVLSSLLQALRYQTNRLIDGLTTQQDTHRCCFASRGWVTPHAWAQCKLSTTYAESSFQRLALTGEFKSYKKRVWLYTWLSIANNNLGRELSQYSRSQEKSSRTGLAA